MPHYRVRLFGKDDIVLWEGIVENYSMQQAVEKAKADVDYALVPSGQYLIVSKAEAQVLHWKID